MSDLYNFERKVSASLEDPEFEEEFFGYSPEEDSTGGIGIELADRAFFRATRIEGISIEEWTNIHKLYYKIRHDKENSKEVS